MQLRKISILSFISLIILLDVSCSVVKKHSTSLSNENNSSTINKTDVKNNLQKVADWQINNFSYEKEGTPFFLHDYGIDAWTNATLYIGMSEWSKVADDKAVYLDWMKNIGDANRWNIPSNFKDIPKLSLYHADELCIGQFYLNMYDLFTDENMIVPTKERADWIISNPPSPDMKNKQSWSWCDALFMAPPVYAHLAKITGNDNYLKFMDEEFKKSHRYLFDYDYFLFFRDGSYFDKKEANGQPIFWGRGNGWVAAGLVSILKLLPEDSTYRPFYEDLFKTFIPKLASLQDENGFWHASLLDPESYPAPETSATALITYALAYGINGGLLEKEVYLPVMEKSWKALVSAVDENGKLGWVQPIGADPKNVTKDMTAVYGVGAFLLAGSEIYNMNF